MFGGGVLSGGGPGGNSEADSAGGFERSGLVQAGKRGFG